MTVAKVRLADLLIGLTTVADLGMGQPIGSAARTGHVALRVAMALGCRLETVSDVFYAGLLQHIGCTAYSHEASLLFADELSIKRASLETDFDRPAEVLFGYLPRIAREAPAGESLRTATNAVLRSRGLVAGYSRANCEVASVVAQRLGLPDGVRAGLLDMFERWDGRGLPRHARGENVSIVARIVTVAGCAALFDRIGGPAEAIDAVRRRSDRVLDPSVAAAFCDTAMDIHDEFAESGSDTVLDLEPLPRLVGDDGSLDTVLRAFGEAVDLKSPYLHGHSTGVADIAGRAARTLRLPASDIGDVVRAGHVHDLGRAAVPSRVWDQPGVLNRDAWSQVHLHAYHSEQILRRSPTLARIAALAGAHHERNDGSGYHRGTSRRGLPMPARLLAAADVWQALRSDRPHRPGLSSRNATAELTAMSRVGTLDGDAVASVLATVDGTAARIKTADGLTERQIDVLRLVCSGLSNKAIADRLRISPRTAERHVQDIYLRIGVSSRAAAAMYAMEHSLL